MKVFIDTLGCPKNFNDSQVAAAGLKASLYEIVDNPEDADIIMVNTCGFINDAKKESLEHIFDYVPLKEDGKKLVVSGCLSERYSDELFEEIPEVDLFVGVNEYDRLPELFSKLGERAKCVCGEFDKVLEKRDRTLPDNPYTQTIKIAEGCNNCCAYCVIPSIRGKFRSKKMEDVIAEAEELANAGCKEIILIAQDPTNYGTDLYGEFKFAELIRKVCEIDGIEWVRLMYCYEDKITDELIEVIATEAKVCHYIDIPIQHSSDHVLKEMRRHSTRSSIDNTIKRLRAAVPDIAIRTTLIVGFPGETDEDFDDLMDFVEDTKFARLGAFAYSQEEGTPAGDREDQIDEEIKQARLDEVMRTQMEISLETNQLLIGQTLRVLVEEKDRDGSYVGRSEYDAPEIDNSVLFTSERELKIGSFVNVRINDAYDYDLVGVEVPGYEIGERFKEK